MEDRLFNEVSAIMGDRLAREIISTALASLPHAYTGIYTANISLKADIEESLRDSYFDLGHYIHTVLCPGYNKPTQAARLRKIKRRRNRAAERRRRKGLA